MTEPMLTVRVATPGDADGVTAVLEASYGKLLAAHYSAALLDQALPLMSKANPALLGSGKYFVAEANNVGIIGCGGWSLERPGTTEVVGGLAHVRHFATHPRWISRGVAKAILTRCIHVAAAHGIHTMEAYATLAAVEFYRKLGFAVVAPIDVVMAPGVSLPSVVMRRSPIMGTRP